VPLFTSTSTSTSWSWSCHFGLGRSCYFGLGLKNLVLFTSLVLGDISSINITLSYLVDRIKWSALVGLVLFPSGKRPPWPFLRDPLRGWSYAHVSQVQCSAATLSKLYIIIVIIIIIDIIVSRADRGCCAVENVAYKKSKWLNSFRRSYSKRHVGQTSWLPATPSRDVTSGDEGDDANDECVQLSSLYADRPTMKVDLGRRMDVSGAIVTGQKTTEGGCLGRCDRDNSHYWLILRIKLRKRT